MKIPLSTGKTSLPISIAIIAALGTVCWVGCEPAKDGGTTTEHSTTSAADWKGLEIVSKPPPPGWSVWESGDGIQVATPAELRAQPAIGDVSILRTENAGTRYQVSVFVNPPQVTGPFEPAEVFGAFFDSFASSGGFRRDGPTERLRVSGHPAAQARFIDGDLHGIVRVVCWGNRTVALIVFTAGAIDEGNPAVGRYLNSLQLDKPAW